MGISLKTEHLKRYKDIAWLFMKYGRSDLVRSAGLEEAIEREEGEAEAPQGKAEELATDLEAMGPTFIKLAQLLSTRADLLPPAYLEALTRLQDRVEPFSFGEVEQIVASELGIRVSKAFSEFESKPVAAASLGQVHRAVMRDGRAVVVKVQRPAIRERIAQDMEAMESIAEFLDSHTETGKRYDLKIMLNEFRKSLLRELDYRQEARNLSTFADNLRDFDRIVVPHPVDDYTTSRVLTMDYIQGKKITSLTPLARLELDGYVLAEHLFQAYLQQILVDGFFHADPHPGNVFLTDDNSIALIDLGMVGRVTPRFQDGLLRMLLAISEGRGDEAADVAIKLGEARENFDDAGFRRSVAELVVQHQTVQIENIDAGRAVLEITRASGEAGFRLPPEFTMIGKTLLNLDQVVHTLDPTFDPNFAIRSYSTVIMQQRLRKSISPGNVYATMLEVKEFAEKMPSRINQLIDSVAQNGVEIKVDAIDETRLMEGLQKIANRITLGLVLAALIVGAALMMRVETSFKILGYPGLAIIFFFVAAGGAIMLAFNILFRDEKREDGDTNSR
ncbi:MAG TPA: AarF/ABC1/UbiB kinase family protein [Pyrinomonadaceae bacterium]|jgi:predicted unusual protein kinase regulating ubiquinone biosynthesis (AarF/ABC1/UbiB family)|nr:AarF/ABC1/UbiB kinase family protein [Pyrinomonadaceae bacterium]